MIYRWLLLLLLASLVLPNFAFSAGSDCSTAEVTTGCGNTETSSDAIFRYAGKEFKQSELDIRIRESLYRLDNEYYEARQQLMDNAIWQIYLAQEAERQNKSLEQVTMELVKLVEPTDQEIDTFYQANKAQIGAPLEQVRGRIVQYLVQQQALEQRAQLIEEIKKEGDYLFLIKQPQPPVSTIETEGFPSTGSPLAAVEVVEFSDYQCPHCKTASSVMQHLEQRYADNVRLVFMDFPINRSGISLKVAEGAVCADQQGKFLEYHHAAFEMQTSLSANSPSEIATRLGLDSAKFSSCLTSTETSAKVAKSKAEAVRLGLDSTPTFFVNGIKLKVQSDMEKELTEAIDKALHQAGS